MPTTTTLPAGVDPKAYALMQAIRDEESNGNYTAKGASGEYGAYQWMPGNFESASQQYTGKPIPIQSATPAQQNYVAYQQIAAQLKAGKTPAQVASWWNSGKYDWQGNVGTNSKGVAYDTPSYVNNVGKKYSTYLAQYGGAPAGGALPDQSGSLPGGGDSTTQPAPSGGGILQTIGSGIKSVAGGIKDDFKSLFQTIPDIASGKAPIGSSQFWSDIGGSINALADTALVAGTIAGDVVAAPETGGASLAAAPEEISGEEAALKGGEGAIKGAISKFSKSGLGKAAGKFAAGRGAGLAAQSAASGGAAFSKEKAAGGSTGKSIVAGAESAALTWGTFGVMNWAGPKVYNSFLGLVSGMKVGPYVKTMLDNTINLLRGSASEAAQKEVGGTIKSTVDAAASSLGRATTGIFKGISDNLNAPTNQEISSLVQRVSTVSNSANKTVDTLFAGAKKALAPFALKASNIADIVGRAATNVKPSADEITAEVARMVKSGEVDLEAGGASLEKKAIASLTSKKTAASLAEDSEASVSDRVKTLVAGMGKNAEVSVQDLLKVMNVAPEAAQESGRIGALWDAIREAVGDDPAGQKALDDYTHASATRTAQQQGAGIADAMRSNSQDPSALSPKGVQNPNVTWQSFVSSIWDKLKSNSDVQNLRAVVGSDHDFKAIESMFTKKVLFDSMNAYKAALGDSRYATAEKLAAAADAFKKTAGKYLEKLSTLDGFVPQSSRGFIADMANATSNIETVAKNIGVTLPGMVEAGAEGAAKMTTEELGAFQASPVGKLLSQEAPDFRKLGPALMKTPPSVLAALKRSMPEEQWRAVGASALGHVLKTVTGLWSKTAPDTVATVLEKIGAGVGGDREVFETLFNTEKGKASSAGGDLFDALTKYGDALEQAEAGPKKVARAIGNAAGSATFAVIHHDYMAAILASRAVKDLLGEDEQSVVNQVSNMTKGALNAEYRDAAAGETKGVPKLILQFTNIVNRVLGSFLKYEVGNKLMQQAGPATVEALDPTEASS